MVYYCTRTYPLEEEFLRAAVLSVREERGLDWGDPEVECEVALGQSLVTDDAVLVGLPAAGRIGSTLQASKLLYGIGRKMG